MEFSERNIRTWAMLGQRGTFAMIVDYLASSNPEVRVLTADLGSLSGLDRLKKNSPQCLINVGIAEQNMVGIAAGLAKEGFLTFATTYSNFLAMRSYEQVRINLGYMGIPAHMVGTGAGVIMGMSGNSHYGIEDLALMRAIPNLTVLSPADATEAAKIFLSLQEYNKPTYVRLTGGLNCPMVYKEDYYFEIGKGITLKEGQHVTLVATGTVVAACVQAGQLLEEQGISARVINIHTLKPLDADIIRKACAETKLIVTVEEHGLIGGLGSAVAEVKSALSSAPRQVMIGLPDQFYKPAEYSYLLDKFGLTAEKIAQRVLEEYDHESH